MTGGAVNPLQQWEQTTSKDPVVLRAAEPAPSAEFHELDPAVGASHLGELTDQLTHVGDNQALDHGVKSQVGRRFRQNQPRLSRAAHAKVQFLAFAPLSLGQMDRRFVLASLAYNELATSGMETGRRATPTGAVIIDLDPARSS
jgi:hypothetical protein